MNAYDLEVAELVMPRVIKVTMCANPLMSDKLRSGRIKLRALEKDPSAQMMLKWH